MIKLACFDFNGTLLNDIVLRYGCVKAICAHFNLDEPTLQDCRQIPAHQLMEFLKNLGLDPATPIEKVREVYRDFILQNIDNDEHSLHEGAETLLSYCKEKMPVVLVSAEDADIGELWLKKFNIGKFFSSFHFGVMDKLSALKKLSNVWAAKSAGSFYIGDTGYDVECAKNAGMTAIGFTEGYEAAALLFRSRPHYLINSLDSLLALLKGGKL